MPKDDDSDVDRTEYGKLMGFLEETAFAFQECTEPNVSDLTGALSVRLAYTERFRSSFIALISIFLRPMVSINEHWTRSANGYNCTDRGLLDDSICGLSGEEQKEAHDETKSSWKVFVLRYGFGVMNIPMSQAFKELLARTKAMSPKLC